MRNIHVVLFADSHLGFDYPMRPRIEKRRRGNDFFRNFGIVLSYARRNSIDLLVHGGDLFYRSKVPDMIVDKVYQSLSDFAMGNIPVYIVPGNHERSCLPPSLFINHKHIHIFNQPKTYFLTISSVKLALSGFPYIRDNIQKQFSKILEQSNYGKENADIKLLCMHQTIEGVRVGPSNYVFRKGKDVVPRAKLPNDVTAVLCGHIHRNQIMINQSRHRGYLSPVIYPGSIERTSFAEINEKKGFYHLIFTNYRHSCWQLKNARFISLPTRPMMKISINMQQPINEIERELVKKISPMDKNSIINLKLNYTEDNANPASLAANRIRELLPPTMSFQLKLNVQKRLTN